MSDMKCPFCQQELDYLELDYLGADMFGCRKHNYLFGNEELWQELIRARKALGVAVDKLKGIKAYYDDSYDDPHTFVNWHIVAQRLANDADDVIKTITALEQKE